MNTTVRILKNIQIALPETEIFLRLGGNLYKTVLDPAAGIRLATVCRRGFSLCALQGRYGVLPIRELRDDGVVTAEEGFLQLGRVFTAQLAEAGAAMLWFGAVTAGRAVTDARDNAESTADKAILDAVASECADAAMDFMTGIAARELLVQGSVLAAKRFSPGYGDMPLDIQHFFYNTLDMADMGVAINDNCFLTPEKSVTAFAAVNRLQTESMTI